MSCSLPPPLGSLTLEEARCHIMRASIAYGELHMAGNWDLWPTALWVSHAGRRTSSPSQAFRWQQSLSTFYDSLMRNLEPEPSDRLFLNSWLRRTMWDVDVHYQDFILSTFTLPMLILTKTILAASLGCLFAFKCTSFPNFTFLTGTWVKCQNVNLVKFL